jgi:hypothetical protein
MIFLSLVETVLLRSDYQIVQFEEEALDVNEGL